MRRKLNRNVVKRIRPERDGVRKSVQVIILVINQIGKAERRHTTIMRLRLQGKRKSEENTDGGRKSVKVIPRDKPNRRSKKKRKEKRR